MVCIKMFLGSVVASIKEETFLPVADYLWAQVMAQGRRNKTFFDVNSKCYFQILLNFSGYVGHGTRKMWCDFGGALNTGTDPGCILTTCFSGSLGQFSTFSLMTWLTKSEIPWCRFTLLEHFELVLWFEIYWNYLFTYSELSPVMRYQSHTEDLLILCLTSERSGDKTEQHWSEGEETYLWQDTTTIKQATMLDLFSFYLGELTL